MTRAEIARRLFLDRHARFWMRALDPLLSPDTIRARVLRVIDETAAVRTFVLAPNAHWRRHVAGQHTRIEVEIAGVLERRFYSIASPPSAPHLSLTVKRVPNGRVSGWLHDNLRPGAVVGLCPATGDFVLPTDRGPGLLFVSGGSGITPTLALLEHLVGAGRVGEVVFVHYAHARAEVIAAHRLAGLARRGGLRLHTLTRDDPRGPGGFDEADFAARVPDFADRETYLCGPPGLMARVEALWARAGATDRLHTERFSAAIGLPTGPTGRARVTLGRSGRQVLAGGAGSLLDQLERAGERPRHGCRRGICRSCRCRKVSGTVVNLVTGAVSSAPDEDIQLCITAPRSDLELAL